jgi:branched-subunit amino acid ABC-type transport system permease component
MSQFFETAGFGLVTASIIALSAVGLSLQFGVSNVPNFAHGEFLTLAAYGLYVGQQLTGSLLIGALIGVVVGGIAAYLVNLLVVEPFVKKGARVVVLLISTTGVSLIVENALGGFFGNTNQIVALPEPVAHHLGPFIWTTTDLLVMLTAVVAITGLYLVLRFTKLGKAQRAVADNRVLARACGINTEQVVAITWVAAGVLGALAGISLATSGGSFGPGLGFGFLLVTFSAAIIGGIGKPFGALVGALIVGLVTEWSAFYVSSGYKQVFALSTLVLALLFRPSGLFTTLRGPAVD